MQADPQYAPTLVHILHDIGQLPVDTRLPPKYNLPQLVLTLSGHHSQMRHRQQSGATQSGTIRMTRVTSDDRRNGRDDTRGSDRGTQHRGRPDHCQEDRLRSRLTSRMLIRREVQRPQYLVQCSVCTSKFGHVVKDCRLLPRVASCHAYAAAHPEETRDIVCQYKRDQRPENVQAQRAHVINVLRTTASLATAHLTPHELDALASRLARRHHPHDPADDDEDDEASPVQHATALCHMHVAERHNHSTWAYGFCDSNPPGCTFVQ